MKAVRAVNVWAITFPFFFFNSSPIPFSSLPTVTRFHFLLSCFFLFSATLLVQEPFFLHIFAAFYLCMKRFTMFFLFHKHCRPGVANKSEIETKLFRPLIRFPLTSGGNCVMANYDWAYNYLGVFGWIQWKLGTCYFTQTWYMRVVSNYDELNRL